MSSDFIPIKRALISLSDKTNIEIIVSIIKKYNIEVFLLVEQQNYLGGMILM